MDVFEYLDMMFGFNDNTTPAYMFHVKWVTSNFTPFTLMAVTKSLLIST